MAAEKEVKAQVKLRFRAANGKTMLATRNLSVTVKKTAGLTMKTLEGVLSALPDENTVAGKVGIPGLFLFRQSYYPAACNNLY